VDKLRGNAVEHKYDKAVFLDFEALLCTDFSDRMGLKTG
jgi:hypothetical protein